MSPGMDPMISFIPDKLSSTELAFELCALCGLCMCAYMVPSLFTLKLHHSLSRPPPFLLFSFLAELGWKLWRHSCDINALLLSHTLSSTQHFIFLYFYKDLLLLFVIMLKKKEEVCVCMWICTHVCSNPWRSEALDVLELGVQTMAT